MFQIFLKQKLLSSEGQEQSGEEKTRRLRNRRLFDRYNVKKQHLTIAHDHDILVIREISAKGFSSRLSDRAFERLAIGDAYEARMRYLGEAHDLTIRVAWKKEKSVGFEFIAPSPNSIAFLNRLIRPIEIANTLKEVDAAFMRDNQDGKIWLHADDADLFVWKPADSPIRGWRLLTNQEFIEWNVAEGMITGTLGVPSAPLASSLSVAEPDFIPDPSIDADRRQFALDLIMALNHGLRNELLTTIITG